MINYRQDEAAERQAQVQRVNEKITRLYFDHSTEKRTGMDGAKVTIYKSKFIETETELTDAVEIAKEAVIRAITEYDTSDAVNEFTYGGVKMWLDKSARSALLTRFNAEDNAGKENTTLWYGTHSFNLSIEQGIQLIFALEVYASECYDRTAAHKAAVMALDDISDIINYDFKVGYPPKLNV